MLRHSFVTAMLDARVDLRDVQISARHADPRTPCGYDAQEIDVARVEANAGVLARYADQVRDGLGISD